MKNSIDATVTFSFKGETYTPSTTIDLDALMEQSGGLSHLHSLLAKEDGIDTYSYLYEVMEQSPIRFVNAQGSVAGFVEDEVLDIEGFQKQWQQNRVIGMLQSIASRELNIDDLEKHPDLKNALLEAYDCGKSAG
jgi:hypothetical protein